MGILRDRMIEEMKLRNFSPATQESYVYAVSRLAKYHHKSPDQLSKGYPSLINRFQGLI
jgi:integrase/recombinase XerD